MPWYVYALSGVTVLALSDVIRRVALSHKNKLDFYSSAFLLSVSTGLGLLIYNLIFGFTLPPVQNFLPIFALNILLAFAGWLTSQKALTHIGVGEYTILLTSRLVVTWIASVILFGIGLSLLESIGALVIVAAIVVVFFRRGIFKDQSGTGVLFAAITAFIYGIGILTDQIIYREAEPASYLLVTFLINSLIFVLLRPRVAGSLKHLTRPGHRHHYLGFGILCSIGLTLIFTSLKIADNAPLVSALFLLQIIASVMLGSILLKERSNMLRKTIGSILAFVGALIIVLN